ncbi:MAG: phenol 2-monooxygenase [Bdellovibrionales bacterium RIFCSPHIGHO2_01_FULL_40_29]|nr:MAG: phenol 2-monooxygenase [Bdellovibrionales bacterium RIFCSPHIGHO2_01_FULL_40_29]OFZ32668.1 MAG: phenol 2-monooxygenase [Bdellovibrionales bacterium RIFCSPHIGHO2_02_FULL_40_15]
MTQTPPPTPNLRTIYQFKLAQIIDHTPQIRELYCELIGSPAFTFKAGQFVMLHVPVEGGKPALRAFSLASTDENKTGFKLIFKFVESGVASNYVWNLKGDEILQMTGPFGKVFFQEPPTEQIIFLNTGSGISQHFSFLESKMKQYPNLHYKLFFGVRYESDIYYEKELKRLQAHLPHFEYHYVLSRPTESWTGKKGYVQDCLKDLEYKTTPTTFYMCGNGAMIKDVKKQLLEIDGLEKNRVWSEAFD